MEQCIPAPNDGEALLNDLALKEVINIFLGSLAAEKRIIFLRRYWFLDTVTEIADHLNLSESKVKTTLFRCRNKLREYLEKEGYCL